MCLKSKPCKFQMLAMEHQELKINKVPSTRLPQPLAFNTHKPYIPRYPFADSTLTTMVPVALFRFTGLFRIFLEFIPFTTPLSNDTFTFMIKMSGSHSYTFFLNFHCVNICFWYLYECMKFMRSIFDGHHLFVGVSVIFKKQF